MKIGIIGVGKMASTIIKGLKQTPHELIISGSSLERSKEIAEQLTLPYAMSHQDLIDQVDLVILGIKLNYLKRYSNRFTSNSLLYLWQQAFPFND